MGGDKQLTDRQKEAMLLVSPRPIGRGLSQTDAAAAMGIRRQRFQELLERARRARPDLFPILSQQEYDVLCMIQCGLSIDEIAERLWSPRKGEVGVSRRRVERIVTSLRNKNRDVRMDCAKTATYESWMDSQIVQKF